MKMAFAAMNWVAKNCPSVGKKTYFHMDTWKVHHWSVEFLDSLYLKPVQSQFLPSPFPREPNLFGDELIMDKLSKRLKKMFNYLKSHAVYRLWQPYQKQSRQIHLAEVCEGWAEGMPQFYQNRFEHKPSNGQPDNTISDK